jgi:hypothetical protein
MAKKKTSVLSRQRPKKNRKKGRFSWSQMSFYAGCAVAILVLAGTFFYLFSGKTTVVAGKSRNWKLTIKAQDRSLLENQEEAAIIQAVKSHVTVGDQKDLLRAIATIKTDETFAKVHFVRTGIDQLTLYYAKRVPIMCYQGPDQLHYISSAAEIYGFVDDPQKCPGPIVTGILDERKKSGKNAVLSLTVEEQKNTDNAIQLAKILVFYKHEPTKLSFEKYRGFYINIKDLETDIALGNPPFETKLEKLGEVLKKISSKGEVAQRIELDFQGKAFIKMKKL